MANTTDPWDDGDFVSYIHRQYAPGTTSVGGHDTGEVNGQVQGMQLSYVDDGKGNSYKYDPTSGNWLDPATGKPINDDQYNAVLSNARENVRKTSGLNGTDMMGLLVMSLIGGGALAGALPGAAAATTGATAGAAGGAVDALTGLTLGSEVPALAATGGAAGGSVDALTALTPGVTGGTAGGAVDALTSQTLGTGAATSAASTLGSKALTSLLPSLLKGATTPSTTGAGTGANGAGSTNIYGSSQPTNSAVQAGALSQPGSPQSQQIAALLLQNPDQPKFGNLEYSAPSTSMLSKIAQQLQGDDYYG